VTTETPIFSGTPPEPPHVIAEGYGTYGGNEYTAPWWPNGDDVDLARCPSCDSGEDIEADAHGRHCCECGYVF